MVDSLAFDYVRVWQGGARTSLETKWFSRWDMRANKSESEGIQDYGLPMAALSALNNNTGVGVG